MAIPKTDEILGPQTTSGASDAWIVGFWWSEPDFEWWPITLGEVREASGNPQMDSSTAWDWASVNIGPLRLSKPADGGRPDDDSYRYDSSGRQTTSGGRGSSGRGSAGPTYVAPNFEGTPTETLREQAKTYVVAVTGTMDEALVNQMVQVLAQGERANFDARVSADRKRTLEGTSSTVSTSDPWEQAKAIVRSSTLYQTIHGLRPDSVDEMEWVTSRQAKLRQLGLSARRAETLGVKQAQAGASDKSLIGAAERQYNTDTALLLDTQRNKLKQAASAALGIV